MAEIPRKTPFGTEESLSKLADQIMGKIDKVGELVQKHPELLEIATALVFEAMNKKGKNKEEEPEKIEEKKEEEETAEKFLKKHGFNGSEKYTKLPDGGILGYGSGTSFEEAEKNALRNMPSGFIENKSAGSVAKQFLEGRWIVIVTGKNSADSKEKGDEQTHSEKHWEVSHQKNGKVHMWHPEYKGDPPDEVVLYFHGFGNSADESWNVNKVGEQFKKSGRKALFVVPESATWKRKMPWKSMEELLSFVRSVTGINPKKITLMGHSGGYGAINSWMDDPRVKEIFTLDAIYGSPDKFVNWANAKDHKLTMAIPKSDRRSKSQKYAEEIYQKFKGDKKAYTGMSDKGSQPALAFVKTAFGHTEMARNETDVISGLLALRGNEENQPAKKTGEPEKVQLANKREINVKDSSRIMKYEPDPEVADLIRQINIKEQLVEVNGGKQVKETPAKAFENARREAQKMGYDLICVSGYRDPKQQEKLYNSASPDKKGSKVASPGFSWHNAGVAVDVVVKKLKTGEALTKISTDDDRKTEYTEILEYCMNKAGFVRLSTETWHFEFGSEGHIGIMKKIGLIKPEIASAGLIYKRDRLPG